MTKSIIKEFLALILIFGAIWVGITQLHLAPEKERSIIPPQAEQKLGGLLLDQYLKVHPEIDQQVVVEAIAKISDRLLSPLKESNRSYRIVVVKNETVNAFALPGSNIVIFSGLMELCKEPEELAAIIAHEIGHVEKQHVVKKLLKDIGFAVLTGASGGGDALLLNEITETAASTIFDRQQEHDADQFALDLLTKAKINPRILATIFRRLVSRYPEMPKLVTFVSSHPDLRERVRKALQYRVPNTASFTPLPINWSKVLESLSPKSSSKDNKTPKPEDNSAHKL